MRTGSLRAALAVLVFAATAAQAHRFHAGITDLGFNQATGSTEIVHTYMAHDIEALLAKLYQRQFDLTVPEDVAVLRKYVEQRFFIETHDKRRLPIRWVGLSVDAESVVIYQEIEKTPLSAAALIHHEVLIDFMPGQTNTINLKRDGRVHSFTFGRNNTSQAVR